MTTKTKDIHIASIKLSNNGNNGLVIKYGQTEIRNNREFFTKKTEEPKFPIHEELENKFAELAPYLLELCNYEASGSLLNATEITGITYNDKGFIITGKMQTIGDKVFALNTPLIAEEDGYPDFAKITEILDAIYQETREYMQGKKVLSDVQYVLNMNKGKSDFDAKTFESLPAEEQWKIASKYMADNKCIVTKLDDLEEDDEPAVEVNPLDFETKTPTPIVNDDDFVVPMTVVKDSTAKKKLG